MCIWPGIIIDLFFITCLFYYVNLQPIDEKGKHKDLLVSDNEVFLNAGTVIILLESCGSNP